MLCVIILQQDNLERDRPPHQIGDTGKSVNEDDDDDDGGYICRKKEKEIVPKNIFAKWNKSATVFTMCLELLTGSVRIAQSSSLLFYCDTNNAVHES